MVQIIRRLLINVVVQPVCNKQMCVAAPRKRGCLLVVVIREIIVRHFGVQTLIDVAEVFLRQRVAVIFCVARHKELAPALFGDDMHARKVGERKYNELVVLFDVVKVNLRVARVRRKVIVVKAAHQGVIRVQHMVIVNAGELFLSSNASECHNGSKDRPARPSRYRERNTHAFCSIP
jgi:hypothetical protein